MSSPRVWTCAVTLWAVAAVCHARAADPWQDPWNADPVLRELADRITLQVTFEGDSMTPVMAAGEWEPHISGTPVFADGPFGRCLLAGDGSGSATYPRGPNATLATMGAVSLWVCPVQWTHVNGGNTVFVMTRNSTFYIERQGPGHDETGRLTRHENVFFLILGSVTGNNALGFGTLKWPLGKWRFLVANWRLPTMSFSLDGGEFKTTTIKQVPDDGYFGDLVIGAAHGETTLLDEITFYRRPLTPQEVRRLYETFRPDDREAEQ